MTIVVTILLLIALSVFLLLFGLGIVIALGALLVGGIFLAIAYFVFGSGLVWSGIGVSNQAKLLPQHFNQCLLTEDLEKCRTKYTVWKKEEAETIRLLAKQVRDEMGARIDDETKPSQYAESSVNGYTTVTVKEETNFAKRNAVREHYVFVVDPSDKALKIKELNWDYGDDSPDAVTPDP